jgi:hypothetical protein
MLFYYGASFAAFRQRVCRNQQFGKRHLTGEQQLAAYAYVLSVGFLQFSDSARAEVCAALTCTESGIWRRY